MNRRSFVTTMAALAGAPNPRIEAARSAALAVLKPSKRDLDHGLQLHAASVVRDAYGFSPRSGIHAAAYTLEFEGGASEAELEDLREEMMMTRWVTDAGERAEYQQAWQAAGVSGVLQNAGEESQDPMRLMKRLARFTYVTDMLRSFVRKAATPDDIVEAKKQNAHALYFSGNGVPLTQNWVSVPDELR